MLGYAIKDPVLLNDRRMPNSRQLVDTMAVEWRC